MAPGGGGGNTPTGNHVSCFKRKSDNWIDCCAKKRSQLHPVFPGGHPSKYWLGSMLLNFSDRTRTGVFSMIWPLASEKDKSWVHEWSAWRNVNKNKNLLLSHLPLLFFREFSANFEWLALLWSLNGLLHPQIRLLMRTAIKSVGYVEFVTFFSTSFPNLHFLVAMFIGNSVSWLCSSWNKVQLFVVYVFVFVNLTGFCIDLFRYLFHQKWMQN